ncbi:DUF3081 family protein [Ferrimonas senticii]|uniref:DUF3081 family protein n=1 Tax=Ferrimonas senticii TaxID=394566 RepID=UPI0004233BA3|nr:DUF3081 family protein [Ferrimonas senticii]
MNERIDVSPALRAVQMVMERGYEVDGGREYLGFFAEGDWDDYNISLSHDNVRLDIGFHNTYRLVSPNDAATQRFVDAMNLLVSEQPLNPLH